MQLQTQRLILRDYREDELARYYEVLGNRDVMEYAYMDAFDSVRQAAPYFAQALRDAASDDRREYALAVFAGEAYIGYAVIHVLGPEIAPGVWPAPAEGGIAEIGYFLLPEQQGRGYATELAQALRDYCFAALGMHRVFGSCNAANPTSAHVLEKAGMQYEGRLRAMRYRRGRWEDELKYGILVEEWEGSKHAGI